MDIRTVIDARDGLQRRLDKARAEYTRAAVFVSSSRAQAKLSRMAREIEKLERGIGRLNNLAANVTEGKR